MSLLPILTSSLLLFYVFFCALLFSSLLFSSPFLCYPLLQIFPSIGSPFTSILLCLFSTLFFAIISFHPYTSIFPVHSIDFPLHYGLKVSYSHSISLFSFVFHIFFAFCPVFYIYIHETLLRKQRVLSSILSSPFFFLSAFRFLPGVISSPNSFLSLLLSSPGTPLQPSVFCKLETVLSWLG